MTLSDENRAQANDLHEIVARTIGRDLREAEFHSRSRGSRAHEAAEIAHPKGMDVAEKCAAHEATH